MTEYTKPPLDENLYKTSDADLAFVKAQSGIQDPDELKKHVLAVQKKAYDSYGHHCIRSFAFTRTKISTLPAYQQVLALGRERPGAILLDLGCCFGTDIRKAASDGFPQQNLIASDLRPGKSRYPRVQSLLLISCKVFWNLGHELFRSTPETFPIAFLAGDALDPAFLEPSPPFASPADVSTPAPAPLTALTSLTPLRGHVAAIHISSVFHLFFEPQQLQLARALAGLLSPVPGSVIFGAHVGRGTKGFREEALCSGGHHMFCHSPDSWKAMWEEVFPEGTVKVDAKLISREKVDTNLSSSDKTTGDRSTEAGFMRWSVTRI
ncbi:hypothetical protein DFH07DRAFT_888089 [Mycena maculata]|uniref:Methyltransferase domain-containing protein n=1 Tax=Mycena maculata TaxID=230809 RepID=A0AAD7IU44_9AGAR|nr:hypothetical protein DFH07DRAFT_888089 [Mycena maculata]